MSGENDPKVTLDIGLGAKASLEARVSTEIPAQSTGRLLDTLTDIIRPFSERRGLKADLIKLQREEVAIEIARRGHRRLEVENQPINPLPNKFLVPFLEKASLEELESVMIERWADLLASSSANPPSAHPRFVQILSELRGTEAQLLRHIALNNIGKATQPHIGIEQCSTMFSPLGVCDRLEHLETKLIIQDPAIQQVKRKREAVNSFRRDTIAQLARPGLSLIFISIMDRAGNMFIPIMEHQSFEDTHAGLKHNSSLEILHSLYLLERHNVAINSTLFDHACVSYVCLTALGAEFIKKCDREVDNTLRTWANAASS
jgi:hypothetical protein